MEISQIDHIDRKIIEELRVDARLSITELARRVGCPRRLARLDSNDWSMMVISAAFAP
jgi:DNA-binding Lrp family transcriptional regulator